MTKDLLNLNIKVFRSLLIKTTFFAVCDNTSSSASVLEVVMVSCLLAFHAIRTPFVLRAFLIQGVIRE
jgi:hypothetical protein